MTLSTPTSRFFDRPMRLLVTFAVVFGLVASEIDQATGYVLPDNVASWSSDRLDVFARGSDNALWYKQYRSEWSGWVGLGGELTSDPTVVSWGLDALDVFASGKDNALWQKQYRRESGWSGWVNHGGLSLTSAPTVASWGWGMLDVFARGPDNALWHKQYRSESGWTGWVNHGGSLTSAPAVVSWGQGALDVFVRGPGDRLWQKQYRSESGWSGWVDHGGISLTSAPTVVSWGTGTLDVFARGPDNELWHKQYRSASGWSGWVDHNDGFSLTSAPAVASWGRGALDVFARGPDNALWQKQYRRESGWSGWVNHGGISITSSPGAAASGLMLYGDTGEPITGQWSGGAGGNAWTVHQYPNRYVVRTEGRGTYVIGRAVTGAPMPDSPDNYMGPGYIGQFSPKEAAPGRLVVNDPLAPGTLGPRDARHGGLGCFAIDLLRWNTGELVDLNCRRLSSNGSAGVYQVTGEAVSGDALGVTVGMTTRYRDSTGPVFDVSYSHRFTAADVRTTYTWQSMTTNDNVYVKEPRIVAVFGSRDAPVQEGDGRPGCVDSGSDGTFGGGSGVWALRSDLGRTALLSKGMQKTDPRGCLPTFGLGAVDPTFQQPDRGGFSFDVGGVPRALVYDGPGYNYDADTAPNFNTWRRNAEGAASPPDYQKLSICDECPANAWEFGRLPGQYGVTMALMGWRASIGIEDYLGRARRIPDSPASYSESFRF